MCDAPVCLRIADTCRRGKWEITHGMSRDRHGRDLDRAWTAEGVPPFPDSPEGAGVNLLRRNRTDRQNPRETIRPRWKTPAWSNKGSDSRCIVVERVAA